MPSALAHASSDVNTMAFRAARVAPAMAVLVAEATCCNEISASKRPAVAHSQKVLGCAAQDGRLALCETVTPRKLGKVLSFRIPHWQAAVIAAPVLGPGDRRTSNSKAARVIYSHMSKSVIARKVEHKLLSVLFLVAPVAQILMR